MSSTSSRCVYKGVVELSIYIDEAYRNKGIGKGFISNLVKLSEENGIWTLQSGIIRKNKASITIHKSCGFRES